MEKIKDDKIENMENIDTVQVANPHRWNDKNFLPIERIKYKKIRPICYYCDKELSDSVYVRVMYKWMKSYRTEMVRGVEFQKKSIQIPVCRKCKKVHSKSRSWLFKIPIVIGAVCGLLLGLTVWNVWFLPLLIGGVAGFIISSIIEFNLGCSNAKKAGIKEEFDDEEFEAIKESLEEGWTFSQPSYWDAKGKIEKRY